MHVDQSRTQSHETKFVFVNEDEFLCKSWLATSMYPIGGTNNSYFGAKYTDLPLTQVLHGAASNKKSVH